MQFYKVTNSVCVFTGKMEEKLKSQKCINLFTFCVKLTSMVFFSDKKNSKLYAYSHKPMPTSVKVSLSPGKNKVHFPVLKSLMA